MSIESKLPPWSTQPLIPVEFNVLKGDRSVDKILLSRKAFVTLGRTTDTADEGLNHGSISRVHAVVFFKGKEVYLMDLGSTHGTEVNSQLIEANVPVRIYLGSRVQFGKNSRVYELAQSSDINSATTMEPQQGAKGKPSLPQVPNAWAVSSGAPAPAQSADHSKSTEAELEAEVTQTQEPQLDRASQARLDRDEERRKRQEAIASFALEMTTTTPTVRESTNAHDFIKRALTDKFIDEDVTIVETDGHDDDQEEGPQPLSRVQHRESSANARTDAQLQDVGESGEEEDDDDENEDGGPADTASNLDSFALENKLPVSHQVDLTGNSKATTCSSVEPAGNRVVTGCLDGHVRLYDFGGMDSRHKPFKSVEVYSGYPVYSISHSPNGDKFVVGTGSCQPRVYDREGEEVIKFAKGDMYIRDLANTRGHTMEVTGLQWHPIEKNIILTSSLDGSVRIWDLLGLAHFGDLCSLHVLKIRCSGAGQSRLGASSCCYSPSGKRIVAGACDGSVHIWNERKIYSRADIILRPAHALGTTICCVSMSSDNTLASRSLEDGVVLVWDLSRPQKPLLKMTGLTNNYSTANVDFSSDGSFLCCASSVVMAVTTSIKAKGEMRESEADSHNSKLNFFDLKSSLMQLPASDFWPLEISPAIQIGIAGSSGISVRWQHRTNQIFCSTHNGPVRVFFDPRFSTKGAVLTSSRAPKREFNPQLDAVLAVGQIINPFALPMYQNDDRPNNKRKSQQAAAAALVPGAKVPAPAKPAQSGPGKRPNGSFFFTKFFMDGREKSGGALAEDPREALLKMDAVAKADPIFLGKAYGATQPSPQLHSLTFEEEQVDFKKKMKKIN